MNVSAPNPSYQANRDSSNSSIRFNSHGSPRRLNSQPDARTTRLLDKEHIAMFSIGKNAKHLSIILVAALLVTSLNSLILTGAAHAAAQTGNASTQRKAEKVSPLLQPDSHTPDERVTVLVTLSAAIGGSLNAFLNQNGVRPRREMKSLRSFSVSLPFSLVAELASFPEVFHISSNENVTSLGHVTTTTGAEAGEAAALAAGRGTIDGSGMAIAILDSGIDVN